MIPSGNTMFLNIILSLTRQTQSIRLATSNEFSGSRPNWPLPNLLEMDCTELSFRIDKNSENY